MVERGEAKDLGEARRLIGKKLGLLQEVKGDPQAANRKGGGRGGFEREPTRAGGEGGGGEGRGGGVGGGKGGAQREESVEIMLTVATRWESQTLNSPILETLSP
jgi:hypothetical protein